MKFPLDLTGIRFGRLVVREKIGAVKGNSVWLCDCDCHATKKVYRNNLVRGLIVSCGCFALECTRARSTTHGGSKTREYLLWAAMRRRCTKPTDPAWPNYGGRGISVHPRWMRSFAAFMEDMGPRPFPGAELDRLDNDGNYEPGNCRWATRVEQAVNRRTTVRVTYAGQEMTLLEACARSGTLPGTAYSRRARGWPQGQWFD